jgi:hypothetical protein
VGSEYLATGSGFTQAAVGQKVYCVDDDSVALSTTHSIFAGRIRAVVSPTQAFVDPKWTASA